MLKNKVDFNELCNDVPIWTWQEIKYGTRKSIINFDDVVSYAYNILSEKTTNFDDVLKLSISDPYEAGRILDHLVSKETAQNNDRIISKWVFAIIYYSFLHRQDIIYSIIDDVYSEFDYPVEISSLIAYMPSEDNRNIIDKLDDYIKNGIKKWL